MILCGYFPMQTVYENSLMQHHVALPPDAMGKITYIATPGQYSLKVRNSVFSLICIPPSFFFFFLMHVMVSKELTSYIN